MFIDSANILVRSGKGGDGAVAFHREKFVAKGGPSGGDGGDGGSVILVADTSVETLMDFAGRHHWFAKPGEQGKAKGMHGKSAPDLEVHLPVGTLVYENPPEQALPQQPDPDDPDALFEQVFMTGQQRAELATVRAPQPGEDPTGPLLCDLDTPGKRVVIARGGRGGFGNRHFATPTNQAPREATPGEPSIEKYLRLELKLIADIGLLGKPNAGKSTFLSRISAAKPKVADYPFTTLAPQLGIAELPGGSKGSSAGPRRLVVADIPGLIEGAHEGHGLGIRFLKHVERTRVLLHLLEVEPSDGSDPIENYRVIRNELKRYSDVLAHKPEVVVLTKTDLLGDEADAQAAVELIGGALGVPTLTMSSATGAGVERVLEACWQQVAQAKPQRPAWIDAPDYKAGNEAD
ncbi:MAG: GTPase ObgE [Phycisphaeraceae bacterium]